MRANFLLLGLFILLINTGISGQILIKNAQVIDVEKNRILDGYNVVVDGGRIISVDKDRQYKLAPGTQVIDATGKYLIPGLTDAHVHFFQSGGIYARPDAINLEKYHPYSKEIKWSHEQMANFLRLYTRAGITAVIDVGSTINFLAQRDSFGNKSYAPRISMTGPLLTTMVPAPYKNLGKDSPFEEMKTVEGVRQQVTDLLAAKTDFIKIWYIVSDTNIERGARKNLPLVQAAIDEAHKNKLRVAVHATERITAELAVEAGADFLVHNIDDEIVGDSFIQLLKKKKVVLCPTMVVAGNYGKVLGDRYRFSTDELALSHPETVGSIIDYPWPDTALARQYTTYLSSPRAAAAQAGPDSISRINLRKMLDAGVIIATGTDAGNTGTQHVGAYFIELKAMQDAGFNTWQLLQSSTINGAKAMGLQDTRGSIAKGKEADMVLLDANPLDDLANWRKIDWVINKGVAVKPDSLADHTPTMLAQQQLNAYNSHDLDAFLAPYAEDVEVYDLPGNMTIKGKDQMRKNYEFITQMPKLYCRLLNRIVEGNTVIDHEEIYGAGDRLFYGVAIYIIENGKISKVYFPK